MSVKIQVINWDKYNMLTIIKEVDKDSSPCWAKYRKFLCKCECWNEKEIVLKNLRKWATKSCWCLHKQIVSKIKTTHSMYKTKIYRVWSNVQQRCYNKEYKRYKNWGWRWIKCEWKSFEDFYKDMWESYEKHRKLNNWDTCLDRINNDWNYSKKNCRWITNQENNRNKSNNKRYKWKCMAEWGEITWIKSNTIYKRLRSWWVWKKALEIKK